MSNTKQYLVGKKVGMTQIIDEHGMVVPVTVVQALENEVVNIKTVERDGYSSVCVGYNKVDSKKISKPHSGQFKGETLYKHIKEFRVDSTEGIEVSSKVDLESFEVNSTFNIQSKTIGRGFTGTIKAWNHHRGPMAHGSKSHRLIGSIGQAATPGKVMKGKKMYTRYGNETVTIKNLMLVKIENGCLFFKGAVPGKQNIVFITGD